MLTSNLDSIVQRYLFENNLPIQWYAEALFHASTCLRELTFDTLQIVNSVNLPVNAYGAIDLPNDFVDDISVCIPAGQTLLNLPKQDWITPLRIHDTTSGAFVPYNSLTVNDNDTDDGDTFFGLPFGGWSWFWNVNSFGEFTGGWFGATGGTNSGYKLLRERRQIQLTEDFIGSNVVLLYISDGQNVDNASQITPMAFSTITAYIHWQRSLNKGNDNSPEGRRFYNQRRWLRARLNPITLDDIRNILHKSYTAGIKN